MLAGQLTALEDAFLGLFYSHVPPDPLGSDHALPPSSSHQAHWCPIWTSPFALPCLSDFGLCTSSAKRWPQHLHPFLSSCSSPFIFDSSLIRVWQGSTTALPSLSRNGNDMAKVKSMSKLFVNIWEVHYSVCMYINLWRCTSALCVLINTSTSGTIILFHS